MGIRADLTERDRRLHAARQAMEKEGLSALVVAGHGSSFIRGYIRYFTDTHFWTGDSLLLIPLEGEMVHAQVTYAGSSVPDVLWVSDVRQAPAPQTEIVSAMKEKGLTRGKVGVAGLERVITVGAYETLRNAFPDVTFVSADALVDRIRAVKSPLEVQQIREVCELSTAAMGRFVDALGPGMTQREAAAEAAAVFRAGGVFDDLSLIQVHGVSGLPKDIPMACDDLVGFHLEICGESGHWSELNVICAFREPTAEEARLLESEMRAFEELRKIAVPGVTLGELSAAFERIVAEDGWTLGDPAWHYYLHGQGMDSVEWPYFSPRLTGNRDAPLMEGMVFSYHPHRDTVPFVTSPRVYDDILITANGAERLSGDWDLRWRMKV